MSRLSVNPAKFYTQPEVKHQQTQKSVNENKTEDKAKEIAKTGKGKQEDTEVTLSEKSKELQEKLSSAEKALKIHRKKFGNVDKPGIYFLSGFDWFGASSVKGNYDGIRDMAEAIEEAEHFSWDQKDEVIKEIKKRNPEQPIILVGHSFGGDSAVEIAQELNTIENGFRKIDLLITLDSVGSDNDFIPQNVKKNLNFLAQGPYEFLNDGPNIAKNYHKTEVENYLRQEEHADLDDTTDIQVQILEQIEKILS